MAKLGWTWMLVLTLCFLKSMWKLNVPDVYLSSHSPYYFAVPVTQERVLSTQQ